MTLQAAELSTVTGGAPTPMLWHDAITILAKRIHLRPDDPRIKEALKFFGVTEDRGVLGMLH